MDNTGGTCGNVGQIYRDMKGIILAGGKGTRLRPATLAMNKHMVPVLNLPMIEYPLATLKSLAIIDILIVSGGDHIGAFAEYFGSGKKWGVNLTYRVQDGAGGIAQALSLAQDFAAGDRVAVILGDNIFDNTQFGKNLVDILEPKNKDSAVIFLKHVHDANRFGVYNDKKNRIDEKPKGAGPGKAVTGLYIYPSDVFAVLPTFKPSARGELEITDVNNYYLERGRMIYALLDGFWSDAGTPESMARTTAWAYKKLCQAK